MANNAAWLIQLTADICFATLWRRRAWVEGDVGDAIWKAADEELERLRNGQMVFNLPDIAAAGVGFIGGASAVQTRALNLIIEQCRVPQGPYPMRRTPNNR